ncbi:MAG: transposase, partial [Ktedonobacteraceae bacterium]|nr:transposase [Ktedonobacteraceae bacterium]
LLPSGCTDQFLQYRAKASACNRCPLKAKCTTSRTGRRLSRHVAEEYLEKVRTYHTTEPYKKAMRKRSVWVEPLFAEGKDWHGMRRYRLRRLWRVNCEALVRAAGQNLKRLLKKRGWGRHPWPEGAENALLFGFLEASLSFFTNGRSDRFLLGFLFPQCWASLSRDGKAQQRVFQHAALLYSL